MYMNKQNYILYLVVSWYLCPAGVLVFRELIQRDIQ